MPRLARLHGCGATPSISCVASFLNPASLASRSLDRVRAVTGPAPSALLDIEHLLGPLGGHPGALADWNNAMLRVGMLPAAAIAAARVLVDVWQGIALRYDQLDPTYLLARPRLAVNTLPGGRVRAVPWANLVTVPFDVLTYLAFDAPRRFPDGLCAERTPAGAVARVGSLSDIAVLKGAHEGDHVVHFRRNLVIQDPGAGGWESLPADRFLELYDAVDAERSAVAAEREVAKARGMPDVTLAPLDRRAVDADRVRASRELERWLPSPVCLANGSVFRRDDRENPWLVGIVPEDEVEHMALSDDLTQRWLTARYPELPDRTVIALSHDPAPEVRTATVLRVLPDHLIGILDERADDEDAVVRTAVAAHDQTPSTLRLRLEGDSASGVAATAAVHGHPQNGWSINRMAREIRVIS